MSSSEIFRMHLFITAESRHMRFKVLNRHETACTKRAPTKICFSFFCLPLLREYPSHHCIW